MNFPAGYNTQDRTGWKQCFWWTETEIVYRKSVIKETKDLDLR